MKLHETPISLLIVGLLCVTTAQSRIATGEEPVPDVINSLDHAESRFGAKCKANGVPGVYESAANSFEYFYNCVASSGNVNELQEEVELHTAWKKICARVPRLEKCLRKVIDIIAPCRDPEEREGVKIKRRMVSSMLEFICHNGGDRIASFVAAGGRECLKLKELELGDCAIQNFGRSPSATRNAYPGRFSYSWQNPENCLNMEKFKNCTVTALGTCPDPKVANIVESLWNFSRGETPCVELINNPANTSTPADVERVTPTPTVVTEDVTEAQETVKPDGTVEELRKRSLVKQIEAAEAQVRAAKAQEQAALAQEQAARVVEKVGAIWLRKKSY